jgi:hypothetical protein
MEQGATARGQGVPNQPAGGGRWTEIAKKMLFRGNEPKTLLKIKSLAFSGPQNELLFEGKKPQSKQRIWQKPTPGRRALDCHAVILRACDFFRMGSVGRGVEGDGEGQGGGWERVRGVLEINFSGFPQIFYKLPGFSCWYLLIHDTMPVCTILYRWMIFI